LKKVTLIISCIAINFLAVGQIISGDTNLIITSKYKPDVQESVKIDIQPTLEDPKVNPTKYTYRFPYLAYKPKDAYSPINPIFLKTETPEDLFDNYIEIGGGNYLTSYLDASIHNTRDKYYSYGLKIKHHASSTSQNPNQGLFSQNRISAFGLREKGNDLYAAIDYNRNVVHYYGYVDDPISKELNDINQIYNDISANAKWSLKKAKVKSSIDFGINVFDKLGENENTFGVENLNEFSVGPGDLHLDLGATYTQLTEMADYKRLFIEVTPHYTLKHKKYTLDLGLSIDYFAELDSSTNKIFAAPHIKLETYLVPDKLKAYAGVTGDIQKTTLKNLSYENLFLGNNLTYSNPYTWKIFAGLNGNFTRFIEFGIRLQQEIIEDQYFFISDTNELRNFTTVADDMTKFSLNGEIKFDVNSKFDIGLRGNIYSYNVNSEQEPWHLPSYDAALFSTIRLADKIYVNAEYFATSARSARDLNEQTYDLGAINDINLGMEYRYKKNISGFVTVNNILNKRYQLWNNYRSQGLNVLAGVTFSL